MKVLLTDPNYKHTLGAVRALGRADVEVHLLGPETSLCAQSRYTAKSVSGDLEPILQTEKYDAILPIGARSVEFFCRNEMMVRQYSNLALPSHDKIQIALDKPKMYAWASQLNVSVPKTWKLQSSEDISLLKNEVTLPIIIKSHHELARKDVMKVQSLDQVDRIAWDASEECYPIAQEYIPGTGYGFFALYQNGTLKRGFVHRRIREVPPTGGASCCAESVMAPDVWDEGKRILDSLSWHGVAMVEFRRHQNSGKLYLMEVNPKFWGSLDLSIASGVNFPMLAVDVAMGKDVPYSSEFQVGIRFHWPFGEGEWTHAWNRPASIFSVVCDCFRPSVKSNICVDDFKPTIWLLRSDIRDWRNRICR